MALHCSILAPMTPPTTDDLVRLAALGGVPLAAADVEALRPALARLLDALARLEALPVAALDPAVQYRML
jgi:hypothetical protein